MAQNNRNVSLYGLLGQGIQNSLSPLIHNTSAEILGLKIRYDLHDVRTICIDDIKKLADLNYVGLNITSPYKRLVGSWVSQDGAIVNTLVRDKNSPSGWQGYLTDVDGFFLALKRYNILSPKRFVFIGYGAIAESIARILPKSMDIMVYSDHLRPEDFVSVDYTLISDKDLWPNADVYVVSTPKIFSFYPTQGLWFDLRYPIDFKDLTQAYSSTQFVDGIGMLLEQALLAQKIWWSQAPSRDVLLSELKKKNMIFSYLENNKPQD